VPTPLTPPFIFALVYTNNLSNRVSLQVPNNRPPSRGPLPHYVEGPSQANLNTVHSGISATEDLKHLASQYLHGPGSHIDKLRVKRSRSGTFKVMILLEVEDAM
jgi:hypothetical protein